jgi:hypothetical protein
MSVSWTAPRGQPGDWLAVFRVGVNYDDDWWGDTNGATSGTLTLTAPSLLRFPLRSDAGDLPSGRPDHEHLRAFGTGPVNDVIRRSDARGHARSQFY